VNLFPFSRSGIEHFVRAGSEPNTFNEANNFALGRNFVPTGNFIEDTATQSNYKGFGVVRGGGVMDRVLCGSDIETR